MGLNRATVSDERIRLTASESSTSAIVQGSTMCHSFGACYNPFVTFFQPVHCCFITHLRLCSDNKAPDVNHLPA